MAKPFYIVTSNILEPPLFHFHHADTMLILVYEVVSYWCLELLLNFRFSQILKISHRGCIFLSYEFYPDKCPIMNIVFPLFVVFLEGVNLEPHTYRAGTLPLNYIPKPVFYDEVKFVSIFYWLCFWCHIWVDHYQISSRRFFFPCTFISEVNWDNFTSVFTVRCLCCFCRYFFCCLSWLGLRN